MAALYPGLVSAVEPCTQAVVRKVLAPATAAERTVRLDCTLNLKPDDVVSKRVLIEDSGVQLNCNGATLDGGGAKASSGKDMLEVRSRQTTQGLQRPENVEVSNCRVLGSIRIYGMGINGESPLLRESSRLPGHIERVRGAAPRGVVLRGLHVTAAGRIPLYLAPGVSEVTLLDSTLDGVSNSTAIYLDAESTQNVISNNRIAVDTQRELIALDGSSYNQINKNQLYKPENGGVFLYRNCGEGGTIRHSTPSYNWITGNHFHYPGGRFDKPAIYLGSRDGWRLYCTADAGYSFGSSADNRDFATHNVVMDNQFLGLDSNTPFIRTGSEVNQPNQVQK